jgi:glutamine synthetase
MKVVPSKEAFVKTLSRDSCDEATLVKQMDEYLAGLARHLDTLNAFYATSKLDS